MKKRVVAKAQKRTRRNKTKYADRLANQRRKRGEAVKERRFLKDTKPNRSTRRTWASIIGREK